MKQNDYPEFRILPVSNSLICKIFGHRHDVQKELRFYNWLVTRYCSRCNKIHSQGQKFIDS